jgi:serine phosphatase RsbU (regulator of sigma subunit)
METDIEEKRFNLNKAIFNIAKVFWPELISMPEQSQLVGAGEVLTFLYTSPLALSGLIWLIKSTDLTIFRQGVPALALILAIFVLFTRVNYFIIIEIRKDRYGSGDGSLAFMILWSAIFIYGPSAIWIAIIWSVANFAWNWTRYTSTANRWNLIRNLTAELTTNTLGILLSLTFYQALGGQFPIGGLSNDSVLPAFIALIVYFLAIILVWSIYIVYHLGIQKYISEENSIQPILKFFLLVFGLPSLANPFAILASGLYVMNGLSIYLFFLTGILLVAYMARRLSWAVEASRHQSRQLEKLEHLGRAIIDAPPDGSELPGILKKHGPDMFPSSRIAIWLFPDSLVLKHPEDWDSIPKDIWDYLLNQTSPQAFTSRDKLPWDEKLSEHNAMVITPILNVKSGRPIGGIYLEMRSLVQPWDRSTLENFFSGVQSLAAQIASALHQAEIYQQTLEYQKVSQELQLAGRIQASFLPNKFPNITGWQLAVTLLPARETSGDFFDVIELEDDRLGILIADVTDKGVGPALYMALSRTLIRTYAIEYDADPEVIFYAANQRLLHDSRANLFVTAFYGVLDPKTGTLTYCNAGHNPPFLFKNSDSNKVAALGRTGMALGVEEESTWVQSSVQIEPGDVLILYTDGIPDSQNTQGEFFNDESIIEVAQNHLERTAYELQEQILQEVQDFVGNAPQFDDITLMILARDR